MKSICSGLLLCSLILAGCTESPSPENAAGNSADSSNGTGTGSTATPVAVTTVSLRAGAGFTFNNQVPLTLQVELNALANEDTLVNICLPLARGNIDRSNCLLRTRLNAAGQLDTQLDLAAHHHQLYLEVWQRSNLAQPLVYHWDTSQGNHWLIQE